MTTTLITGATRGIGRAMVEGFAAAGHRVVGCGRSQLGVQGLSEAFPSPHHFQAVDVSDTDTVSRWAEAVLATEVPTLLINNAGLINRPAPLWEIDDAEFRAVLETNVVGMANVIRAFLPAMIARGKGVVVNLSSGWGRSTSPEVAPYCASKYAVEGLTSALSQELPPGMAAVSLSPGVVDTDMLRVAWSDGASAYPSPSEWLDRAMPLLLGLGPSDNGQVMSIR